MCRWAVKRRVTRIRIAGKSKSSILTSPASDIVHQDVRFFLDELNRFHEREAAPESIMSCWNKVGGGLTSNNLD